MADQTTLADHQGMNPMPEVATPDVDPETMLAEVVRLGLPRMAVPRHLGGDDADMDELIAAIDALAKRDTALAWLAWSQRMAVEALVQTPNVALREHLLPSLLDGSLAGALSWRADLGLSRPRAALQAHALERGWHLSGQVDEVPNLQWSGFAMVCPAWFGSADQGGRLAWVVLRSEEDGLRPVLDRGRAIARRAACGTVHLHDVYFREDELLADEVSTLAMPLRLLDQALRPALLMGAYGRHVPTGAPTSHAALSSSLKSLKDRS